MNLCLKQTAHLKDLAAQRVASTARPILLRQEKLADRKGWKPDNAKSGLCSDHMLNLQTQIWMRLLAARNFG